ncbi:unnamed protein product [Knipowitschia caucasica]
MSRPYNKKNGIPDRWLDYRAVGKRLPGSRFIAFKVPLKMALTRRLAGSDVFGPWELLDTLNKEKEELGLIIDLTFTTRYYRQEDLPESMEWVKIFTAGHEVPSDATILSFKRAVCRFIRDNTDNDKLIGVHCTHGLNRTGYLVCRYLIDVDGMDPHRAIELFNSTRGHAIERKNYLDDLLSGPKRSNVGIEESEQEPVKGSATCRPLDSEGTQRYTEERRTAHEPNRYRPVNHNPHPPSHSAAAPGTGLLSSPPLPPVGTPFSPYHWSPPQTNYQWRGPFPGAEIRTRPPGSTWVRRGRGNDSYPPAHGPYVARQWPNDRDSYSHTPKWDVPNWRTPREQSHREEPRQHSHRDDHHYYYQ